MTEIRYDPGAIASALANIGTNAKRYTDAGEAIMGSYQALDAVSEGASANARNEYQSKQAQIRASFEDLVQRISQSTNQASENAQATDQRYAAI